MSKAELILAEMAFRRRWPMADEKRAELIARIEAITTDSSASPALVTAARRTLDAAAGLPRPPRHLKKRRRLAFYPRLHVQAE
jgi:hypothetical protein